MEVSLQNVTPDAEKSLVEIARVSSSRTDKTEDLAGLINYMIRNKHWSPFEHSYMTMKIVTSKSIAIQFLRHRSFTFQEFSQRYAKVDKFEPMELRLQATENRQSSTTTVGSVAIAANGNVFKSGTQGEYVDILDEVGHHLFEAKRIYNLMIERGIAKECARFILPMTTQTTLYMTGAIRNWIHFLDLRDDPHAQLEAQLIAKEIKKVFIEQFPIVSKALDWA